MPRGDTPTPSWERQGDTLVASVQVSPLWQAAAEDYSLHRLRALRARPHGLLHPDDVRLQGGQLVLHFPAGSLDPAPQPDQAFEPWRRRVLLPALHALAESLSAGITGFTPIGARWLVPPAWFLPSSAPEQSIEADLTRMHAWLSEQRRQVQRPPSSRDIRLVDSLLGALAARDLQRLQKLLSADLQDSARRQRHTPLAPSFLSLLTEAELLERLGHVLRFHLVSRAEAQRLGLHVGHGDQLVEVDTQWQDPHFPPLKKPSPQELWDSLIEESRTTPSLVVLRLAPNPLRKAPTMAPRARWIGTHIDQPYLTLRPEGNPLPKHGWLLLTNAGDDTLMLRKRDFTAFAGRHPALHGWLTDPPPHEPFEHNPQPRDALEEAVLGRRGVFPVQGPPGTGKTYLATQVVRRFLATHPGGRVLVCAKEHFALDHILRKITVALQEDALPCRAWRSVSQARLRRARGETETHWLAPAVTRGLAERRWAPEAEAWAHWQACTSESHDLRLASLGQQAANLFFCTTMDAAMVSFLEAESFDLVIVEEAGKCYPSELLHAVGLGRTVLLIGDHKQLPPYQERRTREGAEAWRRTLGRAMEKPAHREEMKARFGATFEGLLALAQERGPPSQTELSWIRPFELLFNRSPARHRIEEQFRMEAPLSRVIGQVFYGKPFQHRKHELVARGLLPARPLGDVLPPQWDVPLLWINTPHMLDVPEATEDPAKRGVRDNRYELELLLAYLRRLRPAEPIDMVILTPYNAQKSLLLDSPELRALCEGLTDEPFERVIRTTDEYQGREAELTLLSLVRNNSLGARAWGFMTELERLNVMFSRTRFRQVVVGCGAHIERHAEEAEWLHKVWLAYQREARDRSCALILDAQEVLDG